MLFSQVAQHVFAVQQVSLRVPFPVSTRLRYFSLCSNPVRTLKEPVKGIEQHVYLVAHPVGPANVRENQRMSRDLAVR